MAWRDHKRPKFKMCKGYERRPHEMLYDNDFPLFKRKLKDGTTAVYAGTLCKTCKNRYDRDRRRNLNRANGKAIRPQDVPWKRYQGGNEPMPVRQGTRLVIVSSEETAA